MSPLVAKLGDRDVTGVTPMDAHRVAIDICPDASPATRNRQALTPIRAILYHAHELGWRMPAWIRPFRALKARGEMPASRRWLERFVEQCDADGLPHLGACVLYMNLTGARVSEAISLLGGDVDLGRRTAMLVKTKTEINSLRHLPDHLAERIRALGPGPDDRVFRYTSRFSVNERIAAVCQRADLPFKSSHRAGRHAFATNALNGGVSVRVAMDAGGWRTSSIFLETYTHTIDAGRTVRDLFDAQHHRDQF